MAAAGISVRILGPADAGVLDRVAAGVFDGPVVAAHRDRFLATENHVIIVALSHDGPDESAPESDPDSATGSNSETTGTNTGSADSDAPLVVGMATGVYYCHPDKPETLWVNEVGTGDDWRRRGIARKLMTALFAHAKARGVVEAWLGTENDNHAARGLYETLEPEEEEPFILYEFEL